MKPHFDRSRVFQVIGPVFSLETGEVVGDHLNPCGVSLTNAADDIPPDHEGDTTATQLANESDGFAERIDGIVRTHANLHAMSYDDAFSAVSRDRPELFASMRRSSAFRAPANDAGRSPSQLANDADVQAERIGEIVRTHANLHAVSYDDAFSAVTRDRPELFAGMRRASAFRT